MARTRLIHPDAPHDEALARCSPLARLTWAYLPCHADREGRLEDKAFSLKLAILPLDQVDMADILDELAGAGLIQRYDADGRRYIQIRTFAKHQRPHVREERSSIPALSRVIPGEPRQAKANQGSVEASHGEPDARSGAPRLPVSDPDPVSDPVRDPDPDAPARSEKDVRSAGNPTGYDLQFWYGGERNRVFPNTLPAVPPDSKGKASALASSLTPDEVADIRPTIRLHLEHVRDRLLGWDDQRLEDLAFGFGSWVSKFPDLREELHGLRPKPGKARAPGKAQGGVHYEEIPK